MHTSTFWARWLLAAAMGVSGLTLVGVASAGNNNNGNDNNGNNNGDNGNHNGQLKKAATAVPEIPVAGVGAALVLILGGAAVALDRRRKRLSE